jgi:serine/threonine protein kinase
MDDPDNVVSEVTRDTRWERVKQLFDAGCRLADDEQQRWLAEVCGTDQDLRAELASLLRAHRRAGGFMETPALASPAAAEAVFERTQPMPGRERGGSRIGPYRVLRELGSGGMGVVYLGARDDAAFEKLVAIKIVQGIALRPMLQARFEEERRILAALDHPGIARLLDAGTTEDGVPYVVMEYVEGQPIDSYCRSHRLSLRERIQLFCRVCEAVQYSHQRLVVHRDIKAGNLLVTSVGEPKLLDFGIAKMLEPEALAGAATRTLLRALTLDSASPEQVRGEPVTVASDVYSLGVLLYRLLTDASPYRSQPTTEAEIVRAVCRRLGARAAG